MVVSAHGVEPVPAWERLFRGSLGASRGTGPVASGSWLHGPDGVLLVRGRGVTPGATIEDATILDVVPTMLYLLGLPVERELPGELLRRLFTRGFLESHPLQLVPGRATGRQRL